MRKRRDTWGRPDLTEWFLYHTRIGRAYDELDQVGRDSVKVTVGMALACVGLLIYIAIIYVS